MEQISALWKDNCFNEILDDFEKEESQLQNYNLSSSQSYDSMNNNNQSFNNEQSFCEQQQYLYQNQKFSQTPNQYSQINIENNKMNLTFEQMMNMYEKDTESPKVEDNKNNNLNSETLQFSQQINNSSLILELDSTQEQQQQSQSPQNAQMQSSKQTVILQQNYQQQQQQQYHYQEKLTPAQELQNELQKIREMSQSQCQSELPYTSMDLSQQLYSSKKNNNIQYCRKIKNTNNMSSSKNSQQATQSKKKLYTQTNTSHITFNMINQLFPYLIKVFQQKIPCKCDSFQVQAQQQLQQSSTTSIQNLIFQNQEEGQENQYRPFFCKRCFQMYQLLFIKVKGKKTKRTFEQLWTESKTIQVLSEDFFLNRGCASILDHNSYRNEEGKLALFDSLPKFLDGVRNKVFKKLIG